MAKTDKVVNRSRKWFITINEGAECYEEVITILKGVEKLNYSLILHNKDNEEQPHYHAVLNFVNQRTFEQVGKILKGAHIEVVGSMYLSCRYLLHLDETDKHHYDIEELITNCNEVEYYMTNDDYSKLDVETILESISTGKVYNMTSAIKTFGIRQVNTHRNLIKELIEEATRYQPTLNTFEQGYEMAEAEWWTKMELLKQEYAEVIEMNQSQMDLFRRQHDMYKNKIGELENEIYILQNKIKELS